MSRAEDEAAFGRLRQPVLLALLYAFAGPLVGGGTLFLIVTAGTVISGNGPQGFLLPLILVFAYFIGGIPAFVTGLLVVAWSVLTGTRAPYPAVALMGAATGFLGSLLQHVLTGPMIMGPPDAPSPVWLFAVFGLLGAFAAVVVRGLGRRLHETPA